LLTRLLVRQLGGELSRTEIGLLKTLGGGPRRITELAAHVARLGLMCQRGGCLGQGDRTGVRKWQALGLAHSLAWES